MNIQTKFNIKDRAWYMSNNKPTEVIISAVETFNAGTNQDSIKYSASNVDNSTSWLDHANIHEGVLFCSKKALLASL